MKHLRNSFLLLQILILVVFFNVNTVLADDPPVTGDEPYEQPDIDYRDEDLFVDPADIFDKNPDGEKDPWKRYAAATEIFDPSTNVHGIAPIDRDHQE